MSNQWDVEDKIFLITGGASGLGAAYAEVLLRLGAKNVAILDVAVDVGKATATRLNESFPNQVLFVKCDVSIESDIQKAFDEVLDKYKQIDVLINNAGIMNDSPNVYRTACDVNWKGLVSFTFKGIKHMSKEEGGVGGTIVNISSTAALRKFPVVPVYNGCKIAVLHFSQCIALDPFYERTGIRVLTICFGPTDTPIFHGLEKRSYNERLGKEFDQLVKSIVPEYQKVESAMTAFVEMFKTGAPGTIWLSLQNKPVRNITPVIDKVFKELNDLAL